MARMVRLTWVIALIALVGCSKQSDTPVGSSGEPKKDQPYTAQANSPRTGSSDLVGQIGEVIGYLAEAKRDTAKLQAFTISNALKAWYIKNDSFPTSLEMLVNPPDGKPFLEGGKDAIIDPWGKPFQFRTKDDNQAVIVEVWTISPNGTRIDNARSK